VSFIRTRGRTLGAQEVTIVHAEGTAQEQRHQLDAIIQADSGFFDIDAPVYEGDIVEASDPRGGTRRLLVRKLDINQAPSNAKNMSHIQAHWGTGPAPSPPPSRRKLMVFLFTDIVGSTERAREVGDRQWSELLANHRATIRAQLANHAGTEVDTAGDGFFATFESASDAVDCALESLAALKAQDMTIRAGVHVGEAEPGEKPAGLAVNAAARVMSVAPDGTLYVSHLVANLLHDEHRFEFEDRGEFNLKGVGTMRLAEARRNG
jgi:class 3 adenylate cyclase